ncbi:MAG: zinc ABC transporter substrate-binding protein [Planctomycetes bacterium]|nr:zinc ABC transporter substrate-binding protein [Planctomycetota bacterium]MCB9909530.1 zinc ABC transporter substrate-binding protein [Planctomycetota bacterium]MCB9912503.1 zinc ABC transporter substrate-binding protein [Planctomycetota bacterium]
MRIGTRILLAVALAVAGCGDAKSKQAAPGPQRTGPIVASTWPLQGLAEAVIGSGPAIRCLVPPGEDPAFWQPTDADLQALADASWILLNGANFEPWATTTNLPPSRVTQTSAPFRSAWVEIKDAKVHSHGTQGPHSHTGFDPHFWMDPLLALEQARTIRDGAIARDFVDPSGAAQNFQTLETSLRALDAAWVRLAAVLKDQTVLANHPTYTYPAQRYGLVIQVVDVDPTSPPTPEALAEIAALCSQGRTHAMLFEAAPNPALERLLREKWGIQSILIRPAESPIAGAANAMDIWRSDLQKALDLLGA